MRHQSAVTSLLALALTASSAWAQRPIVSSQNAAPLTAFVNVNLISMEHERVEPGQTVVVRGDRIVALGPLLPPVDAVLIEGAGRYLLPGLTDSHVHLTTDMPWA